MTPAAFKDLCIDAKDGALIGEFYSRLLGLEMHPDGNDAWLSGPTSQHTIWINGVPEPHTAKNRVHLDVNVSSIAQVTELGATVLDELDEWTVLADPEGGEFCVFVRDQPPQQALLELVFDTGNVKAQAAWWAGVLGAAAHDDDEHGYSWIDSIAGAPFSAIVFVGVLEPKTVKNRVHIDVTTDDLDALTAAGAIVLQPKGGDLGWHVLADPEGNEFCAFTRTIPLRW